MPCSPYGSGGDPAGGPGRARGRGRGVERLHRAGAPRAEPALKTIAAHFDSLIPGLREALRGTFPLLGRNTGGGWNN